MIAISVASLSVWSISPTETSKFINSKFNQKMHMQQVWKILHLSIHVGYAALQNIYKNEHYVK